MALPPGEIDFLNTKFPQIAGWCHFSAALVTLWLMDAQHLLGRGSAVVEIGVYKGKYLAVLYLHAKRTHLPVVGIDTFHWSSREEVVSTFTGLFGSIAGLDLIPCDSSALHPAEVIHMSAGKRPSFISVDGDHTSAGVRRDLALAASVLGEGGIVAVDDFLNPEAIGVSEGFYRFALDPGSRAPLPFAYCGNKLFCAQAPYDSIYRESLGSFVDEMADLPLVRYFNHRLTLGRDHIEQELLGSKVLLFY
jgi:hypothetical protein